MVGECNMSIKAKDANYIFNKFTSNTNSKYKINNETDGLHIDLEWIDKMDEAIPYIDNIFDAPKRFIVNEEIILDIEKTKKVTIESIKHLAKHTNFISEYKEEEDFIKPSKLLNVLKEETFNTYENRFIYTLVDMMESFVRRLEKKIEGLKFENYSSLDYKLNTKIKSEKITCNLSVKTDEKINTTGSDEKIKKIKSHILSWQQTLVYKSLKKERATKVTHPIKRTNVILKNPNFQIAAKLWDYLYNYSENLNDETDDKNNEIILNDTYKSIIEKTFLINYLILKDESRTKKDDSDKEILKIVAKEMLNQSVEILLNSDNKITIEEIIKEITKKYDEIKKGKNIGNDIIENKIKSSIKELIDKMDSSYFEIESESYNEKEE